MNPRDVKKIMSRNKKAIGMVSSHNLYRSYNSKYCDFWCHCYRRPKKYFRKPGILLSESDFVDPMFIKVFDRPSDPRWDFFYFTAGGKDGAVYKGSRKFAKSLDILCGDLGLRGVIVKYMNIKKRFPKDVIKAIKRHKGKLLIRRCKLSPRRTAKLMSNSKFGFFPNRVDCSPLLLTECIVRDCPVLVNRKILGGWKYVNDDTGALFDVAGLADKVEFLLSNDFSPRKSYLESYGYEKSARRFACEAKRYIPRLEPYEMIAMEGTHHKMSMIVNNV